MGSRRFRASELEALREQPATPKWNLIDGYARTVDKCWAGVLGLGRHYPPIVPSFVTDVRLRTGDARGIGYIGVLYTMFFFLSNILLI